MNIYRVTNLNTNEQNIWNTDELLDHINISIDALYWHANRNLVFGCYTFEKIGVDRTSKKKKVEPRKTETNKGIDEDLKQANKLGLSYGQWKDLQKRG